MQENFAQRMQSRRIALGFSPQDLGNLVGVHVGYIDLIEEGKIIPKVEVARQLASALQEDEQSYLDWSSQRIRAKIGSKPPPHPRYPEAREALIELCELPELARQLFGSASIGPLEAALYGLLIDRMSTQMADMGFWGFLPPKSERSSPPNARLLLDAFFEMITHPEGEVADYKKLFSGLIRSWRYGPAPHRITVIEPNENHIVFRLAMIDQEGSIIPALEPEDPFHALYRMLSFEQKKDLADVCHVMLRRDSRVEIQAALEALKRWHS